ncbi:MAG: helix-turn-helix transcriptional regulator [Clostridia bacterium]|nr:helix-turn-helix transcriptional regulator [Clostridia bacterium]
MTENAKMEGLARIRKQKGLSQLKVAMDLNISREALSYYENGKRSPDIEMLLLLSRYFRVSIDYLITGKESDYPPQQNGT